ncbi:D-ribulose-5-phosphate 3-epimerase [Wigglesworthia glossinidia endosymbiont of Glossina morsitans morsitans (Yale colony)]|uniref:Ribulose-phosphate 3-epimerase n=1 Tax=Wigglesworthia glossinidia endosymbiont of Glossina morsitans morsitans (Yale colony) TaxID=1142511 RepID=H6Q4F5_WIGGL|nr:ribulose-phosphate 3-epimerase [Wigglesworthia glossinidia]AFA41015.1 D-ribulose-5-phosphate 3-epimerase [Wigglesworthia glossinidia endosymbiont of Glossina morsitans morsitans (Yale colony)]
MSKIEHKYYISPSILAANFTILGKEIQQVISAGAKSIHFDVMDNHYVPNLSIGPIVLRSLRKSGFEIPIDIHLMAKPIDKLVCSFIKEKSNCIIFHPESTNKIEHILNKIKENNCKTGLAFSLSTSLKYLENNYILKNLDTVLIMSVNPGFFGQKFQIKAINRIRKIRKLINNSGYKILISVDGGINANNIYKIAYSGADIFVIGSAIFHQNHYFETIKEMQLKIIRAKSDILSKNKN